MLISNIDIREFNAELYVSVDSYLNLLKSYENLKKVIKDQDDTYAKELECRVDLIKDEANDRISELTKELGKRDAAIEDLKRNADRDIADLHKKIDTLGKNSDYLENMNYYKKAYEVSVGMVHRLEDEKEALYYDLDKAHMRIDELEALYEQSQDYAEELVNCCGICEELDKRDNTIEDLRRDVAILEEFVVDKENALHEVTCKLNEANSKVERLEGLYHQACDYIDGLEAGYEDTFERLNERIEELTSRIQELEIELNEAYTVSEDRRRNYNDLTRLYDHACDYIDDLEEEIQELHIVAIDPKTGEKLYRDTTVSELTSYLDDLVDKYYGTTEIVASLEEEITRLEKELKEASK